MENISPKELEDVIREELKAISSKRQRCNPEDGPDRRDNLFGIALSGGGIRSATVNLGILEVLNKAGILKRADYLSTVSGGGYIGGYVHGKLKKEGQHNNPYLSLFPKEDIEQLRQRGYFLTPGRGLNKIFNTLKFAGAFIYSLLMNWIWVATLFLTIIFLLKSLYHLTGPGFWRQAGISICIASVFVLSYHFFLHGLRHIKLWSSSLLYTMEGILLLLTVFYGGFLLTEKFSSDSPFQMFLIMFCLFVFTGFFANPNILTMHRFYRDSLAAAFLRGFENLRLHQLNNGDHPEDWTSAPYPLINTCLNLSGEAPSDSDDKGFMGKKASDYFLLSPLYCGSKLTGYVSTKGSPYHSMTLATSVAVSGAAVNPNMGYRTSGILAFLMTLLNIRLGYWAPNPARTRAGLLARIPWWPYYHIMELLGRADLKRARVSISDGGHIENLAVYELLRRRCRLIIAVDASADPDYTFSDLRNLVIRARNELGLEIKFRQSPESMIKPSPSSGFSESHFVIADIREIAGRSSDMDGSYSGILVYLKSSIRKPMRWKRIKSRSFLYKTYHPAFPHESTADQFFDPEQWSAYYNLGRFMAGDLLRVDLTKDEETTSINSIEELYNIFNDIKDTESLRRYINQGTTEDSAV